MHLGLGIDTGGTYTDSVIVELDSGRVLSKAKALTTRHELIAGVKESLGRLDRELFPRIRLVGLSTTLATNSIVERKGSRVGLILAVPKPQTFSFPANNPCDETAIIAGSHDRYGEIATALDTIAAEQAVRRMSGEVDAFAFAELVAAELFAEQQVRESATLKAQRSGGTRIEVAVLGQDLAAPLGEGWGDSVFIERRVWATAVGIPSFIA